MMVSPEWLEKRVDAVTEQQTPSVPLTKPPSYNPMHNPSDWPSLPGGIFCGRRACSPPRKNARWSLIRLLLPASMPKPPGGPERWQSSVKRPDHGGAEVFVTDRVSSSWFRTGTPYDDNDLRRGIYVDRLAEDAGR